jgi:hypothetical protein
VFLEDLHLGCAPVWLGIDQQPIHVENDRRKHDETPSRCCYFSRETPGVSHAKRKIRLIV